MKWEVMRWTIWAIPLRLHVVTVLLVSCTIFSLSGAGTTRIVQWCSTSFIRQWQWSKAEYRMTGFKYSNMTIENVHIMSQPVWQFR